MLKIQFKINFLKLNYENKKITFFDRHFNDAEGHISGFSKRARGVY